MQAIAQRPTTVSHDARSRDTLGIVAEMADPSSTGPASGADGEVAVARLEAISADVRGCAILGRDGSVLAASGDLEAWETSARALLAAADEAAGEPVSHAHVATEDGEAFAVRLGGYVAVAVAVRFALTSLMLSDMRAVLRDLAAGPGVSLIREAHVP